MQGRLHRIFRHRNPNKHQSAVASIKNSNFLDPHFFQQPSYIFPVKTTTPIQSPYFFKPNFHQITNTTLNHSFPSSSPLSINCSNFRMEFYLGSNILGNSFHILFFLCYVVAISFFQLAFNLEK